MTRTLAVGFLVALVLAASLVCAAYADQIISGRQVIDWSAAGAKWTIVDDPSPSEASRWTVQNGSLRQSSNIYRTDNEYTYFQGTHIVAGSPDWTDYALTATVQSNDNDGWGAIIRYKDKNNYYRFITVADPGNRGPFRRIEKFVNGQRIVLAESSAGFETSKRYNLKFQCRGDQLEVWLDGTKYLSATDSTFKSGSIGFLTYADTGFVVESIQVKTLPLVKLPD